MIGSYMDTKWIDTALAIIAISIFVIIAIMFWLCGADALLCMVMMIPSFIVVMAPSIVSTAFRFKMF